MDDDSKRVAARSTLEYVVDTLRQDILSGRLVPGQRLVEADLTRQLKVSRGPVREAFRRLSAEGLVESVPNQTTMVRRYSKTEMLDLFEIRAELEALAARRAAERMDDAPTRKRFARAIEQIWEDHHATTATTYFEENQLFHHAIADACGNESLADFIKQHQLTLIMSQLGNALALETMLKSVSEHRGIAHTILDGNGRKASLEMKAHLKRASQLLEQMPTTIFRP